MPAWRPISRRDLIRVFKSLGFEGPISGGKHQFMVRSEIVVTIPNPHGKDIGIDLLSRVLHQAGVTRREWQSV